ncbi:hypothetical protein [Paenibacillus sp. 1001270B_150601_E10]|nr:hypothetical protein [Paenibacillus sp. 1001270B_150601_E10]
MTTIARLAIIIIAANEYSTVLQVSGARSGNASRPPDNAIRIILRTIGY